MVYMPINGLKVHVSALLVIIRESNGKYICRKKQGKTLPKWFLIFKRTFLYALMFLVSLLKKNLWPYWKLQTFEGKIWYFFTTSQKKKKKPRLFLIFVNKEIFSQLYREMELKIFFITSEGIFEWQK